MNNETINRIINSAVVVLVVTAIIVLIAVIRNPFFVLIVGAGISISVLILISIVLATSLFPMPEILTDVNEPYDFTVIEGIEDYYLDELETKGE